MEHIITTTEPRNGVFVATCDCGKFRTSESYRFKDVDDDARHHKYRLPEGDTVTYEWDF